MKEISENIFEGRKRLSDILRYVMNSAPHGRCKRWEKSKESIGGLDVRED